MQRLTIFAFCFLLAGSFTIGMPASGSIGMIHARGSFQIDNARVFGDATLFDGTILQTGNVAGDLRLATGARMQLASESRARVYRDRLVLEQGVGQMEGTGYQIEARSLRIAGDATSAARVALRGTTRVQVAALHGRLQVMNAHGLLVANLAPGASLEFEPQGDGDNTPSKLTGIVRKQGNKFLLTDETTKVTVELRGQGLAAKVGKRVEVSGSVEINAVPIEGATQVVQVATIVLIGKTAAAAGAAGAASAAGAAGGVSATTIAIVGGVAAAGTVAGLGITESLPGQGQDSPTNSSR